MWCPQQNTNRDSTAPGLSFIYFFPSIVSIRTDETVTIWFVFVSECSIFSSLVQFPSGGLNNKEMEERQDQEAKLECLQNQVHETFMRIEDAFTQKY